MTNKQFSDQFDVLLNSYGNASPYGFDNTHTNIVLDEYEKEVFLNESIDELVINLYSGKNINGESFESSEELRSYLHSLIKVYTYKGLFTKSYRCEGVQQCAPDDCLFIIYESCNLTTDTCTFDDIEVVPIEHDEYNKIKKNPFRGPSKYRVIRLDEGMSDETDRLRVLDLIAPTGATITQYKIKYLKYPSHIDLTGTNENITAGSTTDLPEISHDTILRNAVQKALASKSIGKQNSTKE